MGTESALCPSRHRFLLAHLNLHDCKIATNFFCHKVNLVTRLHLIKHGFVLDPKNHRHRGHAEIRKRLLSTIWT